MANSRCHNRSHLRKAGKNCYLLTSGIQVTGICNYQAYGIVARLAIQVICLNRRTYNTVSIIPKKGLSVDGCVQTCQRIKIQKRSKICFCIKRQWVALVRNLFEHPLR